MDEEVEGKTSRVDENMDRKRRSVKIGISVVGNKDGDIDRKSRMKNMAGSADRESRVESNSDGGIDRRSRTESMAGDADRRSIVDSRDDGTRRKSRMESMYATAIRNSEAEQMDGLSTGSVSRIENITDYDEPMKILSLHNLVCDCTICAPQPEGADGQMLLQIGGHWYNDDDPLAVVGPDCIPRFHTSHIGEIMWQCLDQNGDSIAQIDMTTGQIDTYYRLLQRSTRTGRALLASDMRVGDVIALCSRNLPEAFDIVLGALYVGVTVAMFDYGMREYDVTHMMRIIRPRMVFCEVQKITAFQTALKQLALDISIVYFGRPCDECLVCVCDKKKETTPPQSSLSGVCVCDPCECVAEEGARVFDKHLMHDENCDCKYCRCLDSNSYSSAGSCVCKICHCPYEIDKAMMDADEYCPCNICTCSETELARKKMEQELWEAEQEMVVECRECICEGECVCSDPNSSESMKLGVCNRKCICGEGGEDQDYLDADFNPNVCTRIGVVIPYLDFLEPLDAGSERSESDKDFEPVHLEDSSEAIAFLLWSTGMVGLPKAAIVTHTNLAHQLCNVRFIDSPEDRILSFNTLHHISGISVFLQSCAVGATRYYVEHKFKVKKAFEDVRDFKPNKLVAGTSILGKMVKFQLRNRYGIDECIKHLFIGGGSISDQLRKDIKTMLPHTLITVGYGMLEAGGFIAMTSPEGTMPDHSVGQVLCGLVLKIKHPRKPRSFKRNVIGDICIKTFSRNLGYYNDISATMMLIDEEGWIHTGDRGYLDCDDLLFVMKRKREMLKYQGYQVSPRENEVVLKTHKDVQGAFVLGIPHPSQGDLPVGFVVKKPDATVTDEELINYCDGLIADFKSFKEGGIIFLDKIPTNSKGCVNVKALSRLAADKYAMRMAMQNQRSRSKALQYLKDRHIFELLAFLAGHLLSDRPENSVRFLKGLLEKCIEFRDAGGAPPLLFKKPQLEDICTSIAGPYGGLTNQQFYLAVSSLGITHEGTPKLDLHNLIPVSYFVEIAREALTKVLYETLEAKDVDHEDPF